MIYIVLVEPGIPGNIGAVARAMENFDFYDLIVVKPRCNIKDESLIKRAKNAKTALKKMKIVKRSYLKNFDYLIATTSKLGSDYNIPRIPLDPGTLAEKLHKIDRKKNKNLKIGILFGTESTGLTNEDIEICDFAVTIPTSKKYPALNLSHSVAIILYELSKNDLSTTDRSGKIDEGIALMTKIEKHQLIRLFNNLLNSLHFSTKEKKQTQREVFKRLITKSLLTKRESFALMGLLRKLKR